MRSEITININVFLLSRIVQRFKDWNEDRTYTFCNCNHRTYVCCDRELEMKQIPKTPYLHCNGCYKPFKPNYGKWWKRN